MHDVFQASRVNPIDLSARDEDVQPKHVLNTSKALHFENVIDLFKTKEKRLIVVEKNGYGRFGVACITFENRRRCKNLG